MYEEMEQKIVHMTFEEFKKYEVSKGWKIKFLNGSEELRFVKGESKSGPLGSMDRFFSVRVVLEKES